MGTSDAFTDRLSDYLDGEDLSPTERAGIEAHLAECAACRTTLTELREVVRRAATLTDRAPDADLWPGVHERIATAGGHVLRPSSSRWRFTFTLPQLVAASLALMIVSGGVVWMARIGGDRTDFEPALASQQDAGRGAAAPPAADARPVAFADPQYDQAIADLEEALEAGRSRLDPETVRVLEQNLAAIDRAIDQCRRALAADPFNTYLNAHLADARQRKLSVLRRATALAQHEG